MTEKLYYKSSYIREFDAVVTSCTEDRRGWLVTLDRTAFYPEGGGQPADTGTLRPLTDSIGAEGLPGSGKAGNVRVTDVQETGGQIVHFCDGRLEPGSSVRGSIDWERRFDHMQQHSGEHIVSGMICSRFHCSNIGFHMGHDLVTIDYDAAVGMEELKAVEDAANTYIWENHAIEVLIPDAAELKTLDYRSKKELTGEVRITRFPGADVCACCGTHVENSSEVGLVKFVSAQKFSRGTRIELLCGKRAFDFLRMNFEQNSVIGKAMAASLDKTAAVYLKQKEELISSKIRHSELEKQYFALRAESCRGCGDTLLFEEDMGPDSVKKLCLTVGAVCGGLCAVFGGSGSDYKYALNDTGRDIGGLVRDMNQALDGRGGGRNGFAQGSVRASEKKIRDYFDRQLTHAGEQ